MSSTTISVGSAVGLHARPAAVIAAAVTEAGVPVTLATTEGVPVDAGSALLIMTLGAKRGDDVTVTCDDDAVLRKVADLVATDLDA
ncbi:HPr family phosphocarrier protein [Kribbella sp. NPDC049174]|uniref:HPr family phosphocarrier protein n=1 Tax=Kribbella sp. NPDC049174 TaxID=3364112 RepID=UPI003724300F